MVHAANSLDRDGFTEIADKIDAIANSVINIKTAQYVGIQGYAVRNSRCWGNCYRNKRASSPSKSAQEIWVECHKEYVQSLNNDGSKWDKYAENEQPIFKMGSNLQNMFDAFDRKIAHLIDNKVKTGVDHGSAIFASIDEATSESQERMLEMSNQLLSIAGSLVSKPKISESLTRAAEELVKEAGLMDFMSGAWQGAKNWAGDVNFMGTLNRQIGEMNGFVDQLKQEKAQYEQVKQAIAQSMNGIFTSIKAVAENPQSTSKQKQYAQSALQSLSMLKGADSKKLIAEWPKAHQALQSLMRGNVNPSAGPAAPAGSAPAAGAAPGAAPGAAMNPAPSTNVLGNQPVSTSQPMVQGPQGVGQSNMVGPGMQGNIPPAQQGGLYGTDPRLYTQPNNKNPKGKPKDQYYP